MSIAITLYSTGDGHELRRNDSPHHGRLVRVGRGICPAAGSVGCQPSSGGSLRRQVEETCRGRTEAMESGSDGSSGRPVLDRRSISTYQRGEESRDKVDLL